MACRGSGVQIPSAPLKEMNISFIREIINQTKELIFSQFFIALISLLQVSMVVKILGAEKYGIVTLIVTLPSLVFRALHSKNSDVTLLSFKKKSSLIHSYFFDLLIGVVAFSVCIIALNSPIKNYFAIPEIEKYVLIFIASKILQTFSESSKAWLINNNNFARFSLLESTAISVRFLAIIIMISRVPTVENYIIGQTIYSMYYGIASLFVVRKSFNLRDFNIKDFKDYITIVLPHYKSIRLNQIIGLIPQHFDVIIISIVTDYSSVGIYRFAKRLIEPVNYVIAVFNPWLQGKLSQNLRSFDVKTFFVKFLLPLSSAIILFYFLMGKMMIQLIGSEEFLESYEPLLILLAGYSIYLLTFWIRQYLLFNNLLLFHTYGRVIYTVSFVLFSTIASPIYGYNGIAMSLSLAMLFQKTFEYVIYKKNVVQ